jgi:AraC-like DNA-binding protein
VKRGAHRARVDVDRVRVPAFALADELTPGAGAMHAHALHQLLYAEQGAMRLTTEDGVWLLPPRRAALLRARVPHQVDVESAASLRTVYWRARFAPAPTAGCVVFTVSPLLTEMLRHAATRYGPVTSKREARGERSAFVRALVSVASERARGALPLHLPRPRGETLRRATAHALDALDRAELEGCARAAAVSPRTLARRFDEELGMGFREWLHQARMLRAMEWLAEPEVRVSEVATSLGFATPSALSHAFRRFSGQTPRQYAKDAR